MSYITIENFAGGVDRSRPIYASNSGTLWSGINGHMTRGGDFEKRKAAVLYAQIPQETVLSETLTERDPVNNPSQDDVFIPKVVGAVSDASGIIFYINSALTAPPTIADDVSYIEINHPVTLFTAGSNDTKILATEVVSFDVYDGKVFALIKFDNDDILAYYDGVVVPELVAGVDFFGDNTGSTTATDYFASALQAGIGRTVTVVNAVTRQYRISVPAYSTYTIYRTNPDGSNKTYIGEATAPSTGDVDLNFTLTKDLTASGSFLKAYQYTIQARRTGSVSLNYNYGQVAKPLHGQTFAQTYGRKVYLARASTLNFGAVDTALSFDRDYGIGAGFINMNTQISGSDEITSLQSYQDKMAIFSKRNIQIWYLDSTPANNKSYQVLNNTGTKSPRSVVGFGDLDVFYLADTGVRSIRARDSSNTASVNDVGTPIDTLLQTFSMTTASKFIEQAVGIVEPLDGRYLLKIKNRIFVFSYFPSKSISAWSWYEFDYDIDDLLVVDTKVFLRSGYQLFLLGGASGNEYGSDYKVTAQLPFITGGKSATYKQVKGVDIAAEGTWNVAYLTNPSNLDDRVQAGTLEGVTFEQGNIGMVGHVTHIAPLLEHQGSGYASLSSVTVHYNKGEDE